MLDLNGYSRDPASFVVYPRHHASLVVHPSVVLQVTPSTRLCRCHDLKPRTSSRKYSKIRSRVIIFEGPDAFALVHTWSKGIYSHSLCQNHRGLVIRSAVSRALDAQLFKPWSSQESRRAVLGLLACDGIAIQTKTGIKEGEMARVWAAWCR